MRISIVMGFFLPMPPTKGGATEKSWFGLAREFVRRGHQVTIVARRIPGAQTDEKIDGVKFLRLEGHDHQRRLPANLWQDFRWSLRVRRALPAADVTIVNCLTLPVLLRWRHAGAGRIVVMPGRMPKGQYRLYGHVHRVLAVSSAVRDAVHAENQKLTAITRVCGYPIAWTDLAQPRSARRAGPVTIGYVGRIHREKGLDLLVSALSLLTTRPDLPAWRVIICGPTEVAGGGSGEDYAAALQRRLAASLSPDRFRLAAPVFGAAEIAAVYHQIDVFCYPSLATQGETFGVAVAEAMAAGAVPVVSRLRCFADLVRDGETGLTFDHVAGDAPARLADRLAEIVRDDALRERLSATAQAATRRYDFPVFAERLLEDFSTLK